MNMNALMQQAQKMQKDMLKAQEEVSKQVFKVTKDFIEVEVTGDKKIKSIVINQDELNKDDIEILQDLILIATNEALQKAENEMESKLGKFSKGLPGLF